MLPAVSPVAIGPIDALLVVVYLAATTALGIWLGRGQKNNRDYFLAGHRLPTWSLLLSIVATETSTVTFLSVPGKSFVQGGSFTFLQIAFGYILGRFAIIVFLLPAYFRGEMLSAYHVMENRFGLTTRRTASLVFLVTRNLADGLRLYLSALALDIALGGGLVPCIVVMTIITAIYACAGGVRSVVWNDCVQFVVYMAGAIATVWVVVHNLSGGWSQLIEFGRHTHRWRLFDFDPSLTKGDVTFWSGLLGGAFLSLATHGVDQMIVQRYLCARDRKSAGWALGMSGFIVLAQFALFLLIGVALACYYSLPQAGTIPTVGDKAFMRFVIDHMGVGFRGLILAAVLAATMSNLSASFNSSASSFMSDWLNRWLPHVDDRQSLRMARMLTVVSALIHAAVAITVYEIGVKMTIVDTVLAIAGFSIGLLLGLYALGLISRRVSERTALVAFCIGVAVTCIVAFATPISGWWYTLVGSSVVVVAGLTLSAIFDPPVLHRVNDTP
ncbi:MAG TPA: sodium:solute symporter [Lacipirellulaceae bacterium]|nr:sodium:solute symporter [Lacipirellulaceae bacterium]